MSAKSMEPELKIEPWVPLRTPEDAPLVSIVIPTLDGLAHVRSCLESIHASTYPAIEILLVDNASRDGTAEYVAASFPRVRLIRLGKNAGYAGGCNAGIAQARGDYILLLNNDTIVEPEALAELVTFLEARPEAGLVGPMVVSYEEPTRVESLGLAVYRDGAARNFGRGEPADRAREPMEVFCPSGCACLCRREIFDRVGLLDEAFHLLMEDADLGWRVRRAGWSCFCAPAAVVRHHYSATIGPYSAKKAYYVERNRIWLAAKNFPADVLLRSPYYTFARYFHEVVGVARGEGASAQFYDCCGAWTLAWMLLKAYLAAARGLPEMLRKRRRSRRDFRRSSADFRHWFACFGISARESSRSLW